MLTRTDIRIAVALALSMSLHALVMTLDFGGNQTPAVRSFRKQVTFRLKERGRPEPERIFKETGKPQEKAAEQPVRKPPEKQIPANKTVRHTVPAEKPVPVRHQKAVSAPRQPLRPEPRQVNAVVEEEAPVPDPSEQETGPETGEVVLAKPLYRQNQPPPYPAKARRRRMEGTVLLEVLVNVRGEVESLQLRESSGHSVLDKAALTAVRKWLFEPGLRNGVPAAMQVLVPVRFALQ